MPIRLFQTFINTNVIDETLTKRATPIGVEEQSGIAQLGNPVPVVFGTRRIDGIVVFWQGIENNLKVISPKDYDKNGRFAQTLEEVEFDNNNLYSLASQIPDPPNLQGAPAKKKVGDAIQEGYTHLKRNFVRSYIVSLRMILCVGPIDDVRLWLASETFRCYQMPRQVTNRVRLSHFLGYTPTGGNPYIEADPQWQQGVRRYVVSRDAGNMFGGFTGYGGLGFPFVKDVNRTMAPSGVLNKRRLFSEFYLSDGDTHEQSANHPYIRAEEGALSLGTTNIVFSNFIFGGQAQLPRWRMAVQRVYKQTDYRPQWYPDKVEVQYGPLLENIYLIFVVPHDPQIWLTATRAIREMLTHFERITRADRRVLTIQITVPKRDGSFNTSPTITTEAQLDNFLENSVTGRVMDIPTIDPERVMRGINFLHVQRIYYSQNFYSGQFTTDLRIGQGVQAPSILREQRQAFIFWPNASASTSDFNLGKYQFENLSVGAPVPGHRFPVPGEMLRNHPDFIMDIRSLCIGRNPDTERSNTLATRLAIEFDQPGQPKILEPDESPLRFFRQSTPTFTTMNPIHALRETLINKDWGAGIDETKIDDAGFRMAADTCFNEKLSFCAIWDKLDPPDRFIQEITDYVDGMLYFDQLNDLWRLKLIRHDFEGAEDQLPLFNQTNVSELTRYKRQHTDQAVNSLTIKFFNIITDSEDSLTVHDLGRTAAVGNVVSVVQNHPGCPLRESAAIVANREFFALSRPLMSFDLVVETGAARHLGPGDACLLYTSPSPRD